MQSKTISFNVFAVMALALFLSVPMNVYAGLFGGGDSWKEEVLLHDGSKLIVERSVTRGGRHEIGQSPPISEQSLRFTLPNTDERVIWKDESSKDIGHANFLPIQLDVLKNQAYLTTTPAGCLSYNKWNRPNPPYVVFQYKNKEWERIALPELPSEFKVPNLIISSPDTAVEKTGKRFISAEMIREMNSSAKQSEFKAVVREKVRYDPECIPMVSNGRGLWLSTGFFSRIKTRDVCEWTCRKEGFDEEHCPCDGLFGKD